LCRIERGGDGGPTGEAGSGTLRFDFDRPLMVQFRGSTIASNARLLACRELDDVLRVTDTVPIRWPRPARAIPIVQFINPTSALRKVR
jgi:hypothetical protein